jgi:hypothetical protein
MISINYDWNINPKLSIRNIIFLIFNCFYNNSLLVLNLG